MALPQEIIRKKRDGGTLNGHEIAEFIEGLASGRISEGQIAAFAMAVFFNGMSREETVALTRAMTGSGSRLTWLDLDGPVLDKSLTRFYLDFDWNGEELMLQSRAMDSTT